MHFRFDIFLQDLSKRLHWNEVRKNGAQPATGRNASSRTDIFRPPRRTTACKDRSPPKRAPHRRIQRRARQPREINRSDCQASFRQKPENVAAARANIIDGLCIRPIEFEEGSKTRIQQRVTFVKSCVSAHDAGQLPAENLYAEAAIRLGQLLQCDGGRLVTFGYYR